MFVKEVYVPTPVEAVVGEVPAAAARVDAAETARERGARVALAASLRLHDHALHKQRRVRVHKDLQRQADERKRARLLREWAELDMLDRTLPPARRPAGDEGDDAAAEEARRRARADAMAVEAERAERLTSPQPRYVTVGGEPKTLAHAFARNPRLRKVLSRVPTRRTLRVWLRPRQGCEPPPGACIDLDGRTVAPARSYQSLIAAAGRQAALKRDPSHRSVSPQSDTITVTTTVTSATTGRQGRGSLKPVVSALTRARRQHKVGAKVQLQEQILRLQKQGLVADEEQKRDAVVAAESKAVQELATAIAGERLELDLAGLPGEEFDARGTVLEAQEAARAALGAVQQALQRMRVALAEVQYDEQSGRRSLKKAEEIYWNLALADFHDAVPAVHAATTKRLLHVTARGVAARMATEAATAAYEVLCRNECLHREELVTARADAVALLRLQTRWAVDRDALVQWMDRMLRGALYASYSGAGLIFSEEARLRTALYASEDAVKERTVRHYRARQGFLKTQSAGRRRVILSQIARFGAIKLDRQACLARAGIAHSERLAAARVYSAAAAALEATHRTALVRAQAKARRMLHVIHAEWMARAAIAAAGLQAPRLARVALAEQRHRQQLVAAIGLSWRALLVEHERVEREALAGPMLARFAEVFAVARRVVFPVDRSGAAGRAVIAVEAAQRVELERLCAAAYSSLWALEAISVQSAALAAADARARAALAAGEAAARGRLVAWLSIVGEEAAFRTALGRAWAKRLPQFIPYQAHLVRRDTERREVIERYILETTVPLLCQEGTRRRVTALRQRRAFVALARAFFDGLEQAGRMTVARRYITELQANVQAWSHTGALLRMGEMETRGRWKIVRQVRKMAGRVAVHGEGLRAAHQIIREEAFSYRHLVTAFTTRLEGFHRARALQTECVQRLALAKQLAAAVGSMDARSRRIRQVSDLHARAPGFCFAPPTPSPAGRPALAVSPGF
eukprot:TRINITY_DN27981_c0_g1_i1.p1 TRINITY_DN27981_c0_g1~~TRINITY_DN27981_c0_g1_i1.p1  ORF type:complete len:979 (+),score=283.44 TRINITY_DN27981_c0_g1_i1:152-3088(+)